jgi:hypothetical protein
LPPFAVRFSQNLATVILSGAKDLLVFSVAMLPSKVGNSMKRKTITRRKPNRRSQTETPFAKYEAIGNLGIGSGMKNINHWLRNLRGR